MYINGIILSSNKLHFFMYADDITIYFNVEDFDQNCTETETNNELENVNIWLKQNKLSLNAQKTKLMVFHRKQKKSTRFIYLLILCQLSKYPLLISYALHWMKLYHGKITPKLLQIKFLG